MTAMQSIEGYRLSPQQRDLWVGMLEQGCKRVRAACAAQINGRITLDALRAAVLDVVRRCEILRTSFQHIPGLRFPVQVINPDGRIQMDCHSWGNLRADERETEFEKLFKESVSSERSIEDGLSVILVECSP